MFRRTILIVIVLSILDLAYLLHGEFPPIYSYERKYVWVDDHTIRPVTRNETAQITHEKVCVYFTGAGLTESAKELGEECGWFIVR